jgi:hypothetical protein
VTEAAPVRDVDVTVIVTVVESPASLVLLYEEFSKPLAASGRSFEFIFAAHPLFRPLTDALAPLVAKGAPIRVIDVGQSVGETVLLRLAAGSARGRAVVTLPAYRQVEAKTLPALLAQLDGGADVAVAWRSPRIDSFVNRAQNRILHWTLGTLVRDRIHDVACGVRAIRPEVLAELPLYGDFARFLPLLALRDGWRVDEVASAVHPDAMKGRLYGPGVYLRRLIDVLGLLFLLRFTEKPLRFFGLVGTFLAAPGGVILFVVFLQRLGGQGAADRPVVLLGVLLLVLGVQLIALGLIGEMIVHLTASRRRGYRLRGQKSGPQRTGAESGSG